MRSIKLIVLWAFLCFLSCPKTAETTLKRRYYPIQTILPAEELLNRAIIISLDRKPERFQLTEDLMLKAGFTNIQKFSAIDGFKTPISFFNEMGLTEGSPGQKGCFASHLLIWKSVLEGDKEYVFILEDDAFPVEHFKDLFKEYWNITPRGIDLIMVGNNVEISEHPILVHPTLLSHAYILSKKGAFILIQKFNEAVALGLKNRLKASDNFLIDLMFNKEIAYCCWITKKKDEPMYKGNGLCLQNLNMPSTIAKTHDYLELLTYDEDENTNKN